MYHVSYIVVACKKNWTRTKWKYVAAVRGSSPYDLSRRAATSRLQVSKVNSASFILLKWGGRSITRLFHHQKDCSICTLKLLSFSLLDLNETHCGFLKGILCYKQICNRPHPLAPIIGTNPTGSIHITMFQKWQKIHHGRLFWFNEFSFVEHVELHLCVQFQAGVAFPKLQSFLRAKPARNFQLCGQVSHFYLISAYNKVQWMWQKVIIIVNNDNKPVQTR